MIPSPIVATGGFIPAIEYPSGIVRRYGWLMATHEEARQYALNLILRIIP